jgi:hypothetical protein
VDLGACDPSDQCDDINIDLPRRSPYLVVRSCLPSSKPILTPGAQQRSEELVEKKLRRPPEKTTQWKRPCPTQFYSRVSIPAVLFGIAPKHGNAQKHSTLMMWVLYQNAASQTRLSKMQIDLLLPSFCPWERMYIRHMP